MVVISFSFNKNLLLLKKKRCLLLVFCTYHLFCIITYGIDFSGIEDLVEFIYFSNFFSFTSNHDIIVIYSRRPFLIWLGFNFLCVVIFILIRYVIWCLLHWLCYGFCIEWIQTRNQRMEFQHWRYEDPSLIGMGIRKILVPSQAVMKLVCDW